MFWRRVNKLKFISNHTFPGFVTAKLKIMLQLKLDDRPVLLVSSPVKIGENKVIPSLLWRNSGIEGP